MIEITAKMNERMQRIVLIKVGKSIKRAPFINTRHGGACKESIGDGKEKDKSLDYLFETDDEKGGIY